MRLFCFPGFCQSSAAFADWSALLPEDIEVVIVERPGRGSRVDEMPLGTINDVVELLMPAIDGILDRPFAFCGLNNGSILMYELTRRLRRHGKPLPRHLFVGAAMAPQVYMMPSLHHLTTARIMEFIATTGGSLTPGLPERTIRADCAVAVSYADPNDEPLDIPIHAFAGDRDGFVPVQAVRLWNRQTKASFEMHIVPGEHDIVSKPSAEMIDVIRKTLVS
jgi:medium-chain acyl-[acyl-carrier-protein] hydrolase